MDLFHLKSANFVDSYDSLYEFFEDWQSNDEMGLDDFALMEYSTVDGKQRMFPIMGDALKLLYKEFLRVKDL